MSDDDASERVAAHAFLPTMSDAARYQEPKRGVMELLAKVREDARSASDITEAARTRPDLFDDEVVGLLVSATRVRALSVAACAALDHVVRSRGAVPTQLDAQLMDVLEDGRLDAAGALATTCAEFGSSHAGDVIRRLAAYIYERDSFAAIGAGPDWMPPLMRRLSDINAPLVAELVAARLADEYPSARHGAATLAGELAVAHPEVAPTLRAAVLQSLELESRIFESGSTAAIDALAAMYIADPAATDAAIATFRSRATGEAKKQALGVYERALNLGTQRASMGEFLDRALRGEPQRVVHAPDELAGHAVDRVLELMRSESDLDTWDEGSGALREAGAYGSTATMRPRLDALIFTLLEAARLSARRLPEVTLIGVPRKPAALVALETQAADVRWSGVLAGIAGAIAGAVRDAEPVALDGVITAIEKLKVVDTDGWTRAELVKVLRVLLGTPTGRARLVPLLYAYLFDGSVPVQVAALELCGTLVNDHQDELPQLLLDTLSAQVVSTYAYVGRAAVRVAEGVRPRSQAFRNELVGRLVLRARVEGSDWEPRLRAIVAAVRVADDDGDIGARILASEGVRFFADAPSLYGRNEIWQLRRFNAPLLYQFAYAVCIVRHLERPMKPNDLPPVGDADDEIAALRRTDEALLRPLVDQIHAVAIGLAARDPAVAFDLTAVLADAGRPDLAASACAAMVDQRRDTRSGHFYARLAEAARSYYNADIALHSGDSRTAAALFAQSAQAFEDEREY